MKISKIILTFSFVLGFSISNQALAQTEPLEDRLSEEPTIVENEPKVQYPIMLQVADSRDGQYFNIKLDDPEIVAQRLKSIENIMPFVYNESVKKYIDFFLMQRPSFTRDMMEQKDLLFPVFERILRENDMPEELKYLSILESGLNPKAISRSKAVGLWQFMTPTGREMGLAVNDIVDERMSVEKSTQAACKYLKQLYAKFNDWDLALASYNTGPGKIARTINNTGLSNYWDLHPHIHPDTRAYVPQFIALAYMMNFGQEHGIIPTEKKQMAKVQKINNPGYIDLRVLANLSGIELAEIKRLNPEIKVDYLPEQYRGYEINLPADKVAYFNANRNDIIDSASKRPVYTVPTPIKVETEESVLADNSNINTSTTGPIIIGSRKTSALVPDLVVREDEIQIPVKYLKIIREVKKSHKVRRGEVLNKIADKYDVTMNEIKRWNGKRNSKVLLGETLTIYVKQAQKVKANSLAAKSSTENIKKSSKYHTVRPGDTLWNISQRYDGITIDEIKKLNHIRGNSVKIGQKIKVQA